MKTVSILKERQIKGSVWTLEYDGRGQDRSTFRLRTVGTVAMVQDSNGT